LPTYTKTAEPSTQGRGLDMRWVKEELGGHKLNIPLLPYSGDDEFIKAFQEVEEFLEKHEFRFCAATVWCRRLDGGTR
jgi:acetoin utilization deacetylase AcuC-like enzyme